MSVAASLLAVSMAKYDLAMSLLTVGRHGQVVATALLTICVAGDATGAPATAGPAVEEIVVTGSRIRRDELDARDLVRSLNLDDESPASLGDLLGRLPAAGGALSTRFNSSGNFGFPADGGGIGAGASHVDLRHLGSKRVLVLVDGLRWVYGASASGVSGATDLNTLPAGIIERVEVSLDGASAIYGSDAIAGVVNVITESLRGASIEAHAGRYVNGGETRNLELAIGNEWAGTSASLHASFVDQESVSSNAHEQTRYPTPGTANRHGSTFTPQGRIIFTDPNTGNFVNCALNKGVAGTPGYDPSDPCGAGDDYHPWSNGDRFNYGSFNLTLTPSERHALFARVEHRLGENVSAYARLLANRRQSANQAAPEPLWAGDLAESGSVLDEIVIDATNPYNPFGFDVGDGAWATRRPLESGPRIFEQAVDTRYLATGLRGTAALFQRAFFWDANWVFSRNVARQTKQGAHNARNLLLGLGPPETCAATAGCIPVNLLGGQGDGSGTLTPAMLDWIGFVQRDYSDQTLRDFTFNIAGDLAELPAGALAFAAGFEHRQHRGKFWPDPVVVAGDTAGLRAQPTAGEHSASEWYGELEAPLLQGVRGADALRASAAIRRFRYDTFGTDHSTRWALHWRPVPSVLLRGIWAQGFRAPNIGELYGGETRLDAVIADPCSDFSAQTSVVVERCIAAGVPADGSYSQLGGQIGALTGGNRNLQPETSRSETFSLTWQPPWLSDFRLQLNRYVHDIRGAITAFNAQAVLDSCYGQGLAAFCAFVTRVDAGHIRQLRNTLLNVGSIRTKGWDLNAQARLASALGDWRVQWATTHLAAYSEQLQDTQGNVLTTRHLAGKTQSDRGKPRWKSSLTAAWQRQGWQASWTLRYIHAMTERCSNFLDGSADSLTRLGLCSLPNQANHAASRNRLNATVYHDLQASYERPLGPGSMVATLGGTNVFDRDPPESRSATLNGYDASTYDIPGGRFLYLRWRYVSDGY